MFGVWVFIFVQNALVSGKNLLVPGLDNIPSVTGGKAILARHEIQRFSLPGEAQLPRQDRAWFGTSRSSVPASVKRVLFVTEFHFM